MSGASEAASIILLLTRWRMLTVEARSHRVRELAAEARKCSRLAKGAAGIEIAEELEAISEDLQKEADDLAARMQATAYAIDSPGLRLPTQPSHYFQQLMSARLGMSSGKCDLRLGYSCGANPFTRNRRT